MDRLDMDAAARSSGTVISAVMLGAIAGAQILPVAKTAFEDAIRASGKGADASLKGFAAGFAAADASRVSAESSVPITAGLSNRAVPAAAQDAIERVGVIRRPCCLGANDFKIELVCNPACHLIL